MKPTEPPKADTKIVYEVKVVDRIVWTLPPIDCPENKYPTLIGGKLPNEMAILYAQIYFDYDKCTGAYWKAKEWIKSKNKKFFSEIEN